MLIPYNEYVDESIDDEYKKSLIHDVIVQNITDLINELPLDNIHEKFYIFCHLLWNGYFSYGKSYGFDSFEYIDERNTIFLGYGCCRHNANLLEEINRKMGIYSMPFFVRIKKAKSDRALNVKRKIINTKLAKSHFYEYNHQACLVKDNGDDSSLFLLDPTLLTECEIIGKGKLVCINGIYQVNNMLLKKDIKIYKNYCSDVVTLTKEELEGYYAFAKEVCENNQNLFNDFYTDNYENYENIRSLILKNN